jgi:DNA-binding PadR family transcriptional regulator
VALRHAVLAALLEGEASGYELAKRFDVGVANFWSVTPQQLYRELERLESAGLISARVVEQQRRPNKRVFTLADAGRHELSAFTAQPARPAAMRDDLLVKLQAVDAGDPEAVMKALAERLEQSRAKLERYDRLRDRLLAGRTEDEYLRDSDRIGPYLTLLGGRMFEQQNARWITTVMQILADRTGGFDANRFAAVRR